MDAQRVQGKVNYQAGLAAETIVARQYTQRGYMIIAERWRGSRGEIDLIARDGDAIIVIEVKKSKSHALAAVRLSAAQQKRITLTAAEFLETLPRGQLTEMRLDVALVNDIGAVKIIENASQ